MLTELFMKLSYKDIVISARAGECFYFFLNIEVERLSWLIVTLQSREG